MVSSNNGRSVDTMINIAFPGAINLEVRGEVIFTIPIKTPVPDGEFIHLDMSSHIMHHPCY